jgi:hypothetical protein
VDLGHREAFRRIGIRTTYPEIASLPTLARISLVSGIAKVVLTIAISIKAEKRLSI